MTDNDIICNYNENNQKIKYNKEIKEYLKNRFNDSSSVSESAYRIIYNLYERPTCKICGNAVSYWGFSKKRGGFAKYCCDKCARIGEKQTNLEKYGVDHPWKNKEIREKIHKTNLEKYGHENPFGSKEIQEKLKNTCYEHYGVYYPLQNEEIVKKYKETNNEKYGGNAPACNENIKNKIKNTIIKKYGVDAIMKVPSFLDKQYKSMFKNGNADKYISNPEQLLADELKRKYPNLKQQYSSKVSW